MWLAGLRKNMKSCQIKGSLNSSSQKNNPEEAEEAANNDYSNKHLYWKIHWVCQWLEYTKQWLSILKICFTNINMGEPMLQPNT